MKYKQAKVILSEREKFTLPIFAELYKTTTDRMLEVIEEAETYIHEADEAVLSFKERLATYRGRPFTDVELAIFEEKISKPEFMDEIRMTSCADNPMFLEGKAGPFRQKMLDHPIAVDLERIFKERIPGHDVPALFMDFQRDILSGASRKLDAASDGPMPRLTTRDHYSLGPIRIEEFLSSPLSRWLKDTTNITLHLDYRGQIDDARNFSEAIKSKLMEDENGKHIQVMGTIPKTGLSALLSFNRYNYMFFERQQSPGATAESVVTSIVGLHEVKRSESTFNQRVLREAMHAHRAGTAASPSPDNPGAAAGGAGRDSSADADDSRGPKM